MTATDKRRIMNRYAELQRELTHMFNAYRRESDWLDKGDARLAVIDHEMTQLINEIVRAI